MKSAAIARHIGGRVPDRRKTAPSNDETSETNAAAPNGGPQSKEIDKQGKINEEVRLGKEEQDATENAEEKRRSTLAAAKAESDQMAKDLADAAGVAEEKRFSLERSGAVQMAEESRKVGGEAKIEEERAAAEEVAEKAAEDVRKEEEELKRALDNARLLEEDARLAVKAAEDARKEEEEKRALEKARLEEDAQLAENAAEDARKEEEKEMALERARLEEDDRLAEAARNAEAEVSGADYIAEVEKGLGVADQQSVGSDDADAGVVEGVETSEPLGEGQSAEGTQNIPSNDVSCIGWKQTGGCTPDGPREEHSDLNCVDEVPAGASGYCDCGGGQRVAESTCEHGPFTCAAMCASATQCVGWKQTGGCTPDGPREEHSDLPCDQEVPAGASGYCECADGRRAAESDCDHATFACAVKCSE